MCKICAWQRERQQLLVKLKNRTTDLKDHKLHYAEALAQQELLCNEQYDHKKTELYALLDECQADMATYKADLLCMRSRRIVDYDTQQLSHLQADLLDAMDSVQILLCCKAEDKVGKALDSCMCFIGHMLMSDSVQTAYRHTYECAEIEKWLSTPLVLGPLNSLVWWEVPLGYISLGCFGLIFVSARTNKRHHHHHRAEIEKWLITSNKLPKTGLTHKMLTPNHVLKSSINEDVELKLKE
jgi:hypothetical protein